MCDKADWSFLEGGEGWDEEEIDSAASKLTGRLLEWMSECIPVKTVRQRKCTHPWLTGEVLEARYSFVDLLEHHHQVLLACCQRVVVQEVLRALDARIRQNDVKMTSKIQIDLLEMLYKVDLLEVLYKYRLTC